MASADRHFTIDKNETLICALCLEVYRKPKLLPCFHTFCKMCLEKLATGPLSLRFPCPSCRKQTDLPPGGVSSLQNNFYIDPNDLEKARNGLFCTVHPSRELELFCCDCDTPICLKCGITNHKAHSTSDLHATALLASEEKRAVEDKGYALKNVIILREATLKALIEKIRQEALANVNEITDKIAETLTPRWVKTVSRPVLRFNALSDDTVQRIRDYMGSAVKMEMPVSAYEVTVVKEFRCRDDPSTDIYHLCPLTNGNVCVMYEPCLSQNGATSKATCEELDKNGKSVDTLNCDKKISMVRTADDNYIYLVSSTRSVMTYAKKIELGMTRFIKLVNNLRGQATVATEEIISEDPLETEETEVFTLHCAAHRAFDVDATEQLFAVLEEGKTPDLQRRVQLYRYTQPDAIATYIPPVSPFQASDVCFYTLGGREVLLVADELNDAIHVVNVQDGRLSFARYLSPGCPLLVQPTALNTDMRGRLWVACRGGRILTCTPISVTE